MKRNWTIILALTVSAASLGACSTMGGESNTGASSSGGYGAGIEPHGTTGGSSGYPGTTPEHVPNGSQAFPAQPQTGIEPHGTAGSSPYGGGGQSPSKSGSEGGYTNAPSDSNAKSSSGIYNRNVPAEGGVTNEPRDPTGTSQYPGSVAPGSDTSSGASSSGGAGTSANHDDDVVGPRAEQPGATNEPRDPTGTSQYPGSVAPGTNTQDSSGSSASGGSGSSDSSITPPDAQQPGATDEPRDSTGTSQYPGSVSPNDTTTQ